LNKGRLEAFSDGVIAIIITIMVLEMKAPEGADFSSLRPLIPIFFSYALSFVFVAIYWNNHHHLFHAVKSVNGRILWANMHLLFWLSMIPFVTRWVDENAKAPLPVALYGVVLLFCGLAYFILVQVLLATHGKESVLAKALGNDFKGKLSVVIYIIAIALSFFNVWMAYAMYAGVAAMWLVPDRRLEKVL
jgi:uncharacterized membrane protein